MQRRLRRASFLFFSFSFRFHFVSLSTVSLRQIKPIAVVGFLLLILASLPHLAPCKLDVNRVLQVRRVATLATNVLFRAALCVSASFYLLNLIPPKLSPTKGSKPSRRNQKIHFLFRDTVLDTRRCQLRAEEAKEAAAVHITQTD